MRASLVALVALHLSLPFVASDVLLSDSDSANYEVRNEVELNTEFFDFGVACASADCRRLVFASSRPVGKQWSKDPITGEAFMDLFEATWTEAGRWSKPTPLLGAINTSANEGSVAFDPSFTTLYFSRCGGPSVQSYCELFRSRPDAEGWGPALSLGLADRSVDVLTQMGHPAFSADGRYLFFSASLPGGLGGLDIWYASYDPVQDSFGTPVNAGPSVNSPRSEMYPYLRPNGTLYFASDAWGGMGGLDICEALPVPGSPMKFQQASPMRAPINSPADDFGIVFKQGSDEGLFTSARTGGLGRDDVYSFRPAN